MTSQASSINGHTVHDKAWQLLKSSVQKSPQRDRLVSRSSILDLDFESGAFRALVNLPPDTSQMLELCLPLCLARGTSPFVYAHLGQSLDGQIATASGASRYVTSGENLLHMHRLRALADAVLVGAGTVEQDDPQLTTRLVAGNNPVRVVIDPSRRLPANRKVFQDGRAETLLVCREGSAPNGRFDADVEVVTIRTSTPELPPISIVEALARRGLRRLFVEGGGITVSRFLAARVLDRLHVTISPLFIGRGRPGIVLPGVDGMEQTLRPVARRFFLGQDVLFDCALEKLPATRADGE